MSEPELKNRHLNIVFSEPWGLSEKLEKDNLSGTITDTGISINKHYGNKEDCLVVRLKKNFQYDGLECQYFVVSSRHEGFSWWRGGGGFIATVTLS